MSYLSIQPANNPWLENDEGFDALASSSPPSSPTKARKRSLEESFSSPESSPSKRLRSSGVKLSIDKAVRRSLEEELALLQPAFLPADDVAIEDEELFKAMQDADAQISTIFNKTMSAKELLDIRFSQSTIAEDTKDGIELDDLINTLARKGWDRGKAPLTLVQMPDGKLTSLDNRRLYSIQRCIQERKPRLQVPVQIFSFEATASESYLSEIVAQVRSPKSSRKVQNCQFSQESWGYCVWARMRVFNKQMLNEKNFGFTRLPTIKS